MDHYPENGCNHHDNGIQMQGMSMVLFLFLGQIGDGWNND